tara:strand:- start:197 stop:469 length:273 start_codon:yes stop_codon:yes gene_type:complete
MEITYLKKYINEIDKYKEKSFMSGQRRFLRVWARTVGMPIGLNDEDKPEFLPITQTEVKKALAFRTFWIVLHVVTCILIIAGNGRTLGWW